MRTFAMIVLLSACGERANEPPVAPTAVPPPVAAAPAVSPGIELPEVGSTGFELADKAMPQIAASPTALTVKGRVVIPLTDGKASAADRGGNALGLQIPKLAAATADLRGRIVLQLDRRLPYRTLLEILTSVKSETRNRFAILAQSGPSVVAVPLTIPETAASDPTKVGLILMIKASQELTLASLSGMEGTIAKPLLVMPANPGIDLEQLTTTLAGIRARHPDPTDSQIVVMADGSLTLQTLAEVIGAARATADGTPLYPDVLLATGLE